MCTDHYYTLVGAMYLDVQTKKICVPVIVICKYGSKVTSLEF